MTDKLQVTWTPIGEDSIPIMSKEETAKAVDQICKELDKLKEEGLVIARGEKNDNS